MIKVLPTSMDMLKHLKHPSGAKFLELNRPVEWPADQFTFRLLQEGAIKRADDPTDPTKTEE